MEVIRLAVALVLVLSSVTPSKGASATPSAAGGGGGGGGGGDAHSMPCIQKLMPCQPYLRSATPPPPPSCCMPLKEIVDNDLACLCSVFNNVDMLKSLNLTKENALVLPNACGAKADVSNCKTTAGATTPATSTGSGSSGESAAATSTAKSTSSAPATNLVGLSFGFASAIIFAQLFF